MLSFSSLDEAFKDVKSSNHKQYQNTNQSLNNVMNTAMKGITGQNMNNAVKEMKESYNPSYVSRTMKEDDKKFNTVVNTENALHAPCKNTSNLDIDPSSASEKQSSHEECIGHIFHCKNCMKKVLQYDDTFDRDVKYVDALDKRPYYSSWDGRVSPYSNDRRQNNGYTKENEKKMIYDRPHFGEWKVIEQFDDNFDDGYHEYNNKYNGVERRRDTYEYFGNSLNCNTVMNIVLIVMGILFIIVLLELVFRLVK